MAFRFTRRAEASGWLSVKLSRSGTLASLCEYTKVEMLREAGGRVYFTIMDGFTAVGEEASLNAANAKLYLAATGPVGPAVVTVEYTGAPSEETSRFKGKLKQQWAKMTFAGQTAQVTLNSIWDGTYTPLPPGTHSILAPDYSHKAISTAGYVSAAPGMIGNDVWFPIGLNGTMNNSSRYIHVGHLSEGCVTVHEIEKWTAVYTYLISCRAPDQNGQKVGLLTVKK